MGSETACPTCGVILPPRGLPTAPVGSVSPAEKTLGAPRPKTAEEAKVWAGLPVAWSKEGGDTSPDPVEAPRSANPNAAPPPVPAPFLSAPVPPVPVAAGVAPAPAPAKPASGAAPKLVAAQERPHLPPGPTGLELADEKKRAAPATSRDWDRKWARAEMEAKRGQRGGGGKGRALLYLFGLVVVLAVTGAIAAESMGLIETPSRATPIAAATATGSPTAIPAATATPKRTPVKIPDGYDRAKKLSRAAALAKAGKTKDAIREYASILELEPELAEAHYRQAALYAKRKDYGNACVAFRRYLDIEPEGRWAKEANAGAVRCR